ncbi:feruloyl esterase [Aspergillus undulatus]|uniref:feruloyl esterase n=1 Tax=Aspergillus undulatus TaxID=1810928 RepID=UPI003CCDEE37
MTQFASENYRTVQPDANVENVDFCNVTAWLPDKENWNERYLGAGGGGFTAGRWFMSDHIRTGAIGEGYLTSSTDGGLGPVGLNTGMDSTYILRSPGNVDQYTLRNFASVSLNEQAIISKPLAKTFYGKPPLYSYWNGCSGGGRQGLKLAQQYPRRTTASPLQHQLLTTFNPSVLVGTLTHCSQIDSKVKISSAAATVIKALWKGVVTPQGEQITNPYTPGCDFTGVTRRFLGIANTDCSRNDSWASQPNVPGQQWVSPLDAKDPMVDISRCQSSPNGLPDQFLRLWIGKDSNIDLSKLTVEKFVEMVLEGAREYAPLFATNDPDLSKFRDAGGKMITVHGVADSHIPIRNSVDYYENVRSLLPDVGKFYRYFEIPGWSLCFGGTGGQPTAIFDQLRAWVENGTAPESSPVSFVDSKGVEWNRILCPFPQKSQYSKEWRCDRC